LGDAVYGSVRGAEPRAVAPSFVSMNPCSFLTAVPGQFQPVHGFGGLGPWGYGLPLTPQWYQPPSETPVTVAASVPPPRAPAPVIRTGVAPSATVTSAVDPGVSAVVSGRVSSPPPRDLQSDLLSLHPSRDDLAFLESDGDGSVGPSDSASQVRSVSASASVLKPGKERFSTSALRSLARVTPNAVSPAPARPAAAEGSSRAFFANQGSSEATLWINPANPLESAMDSVNVYLRSSSYKAEEAAPAPVAGDAKLSLPRAMGKRKFFALRVWELVFRLSEILTGLFLSLPLLCLVRTFVWGLSLRRKCWSPRSSCLPVTSWPAMVWLQRLLLNVFWLGYWPRSPVLLVRFSSLGRRTRRLCLTVPKLSLI
jgi:hypothetical protein